MQVRQQKGQGLVEYVLIIALVGLASVVALGFLSGKINNLFSKTGNVLNGVTVSAGPAGPPPPPPPSGGSASITGHNSLGDANAGINVDGSPDAGDFLRGSTSGWSNTPTSYSFTWEVNTNLGADCSTASGWSAAGGGSGAPTFNVIGPVTVNGLWDPYRVTVTASNAGGSSAPVTACVIVFP
jgi:Flp pilus assembly pilin Flp